ncbi:hypothetical protein [Candidatus Chloroploca asiatica]|uniref:Uncharacterized protein n=1 Tax=Candidatus Chloroploca asiatica TaxID=1506545 RepID=A0A2H3KIR1_9CHLR|nr:hypothetical protein [Candidatus Chloroploca asiatica]PDV97028.1 hypothetical protein A9Q02_19665 [Candidatus Chloroploca asiatica]
MTPDVISITVEAQRSADFSRLPAQPVGGFPTMNLLDETSQVFKTCEVLPIFCLCVNTDQP